MGWRFRKYIKIAPGVKLNISKSGVSTTIGGKGASVNIGKNGAYLNTSIPGTGLYNRQKLSTGKKHYRPSNMYNTQNNKKSYFSIGNNWGCVFRWFGLFALIYLIISLIQIVIGNFEKTEENIHALLGAVICVILIFFKPIMNFFKSLFSNRKTAIITSNNDDGKEAENMVSEESKKKADGTMTSTDGIDNNSNNVGNNPASSLRIIGEAVLEPYDPKRDLENYHYPTLDLLKKYELEGKPHINIEEQKVNKNRIVELLNRFGIDVVSIKATIGPAVTLYELTPAPGMQMSKIRDIEEEIALSLSPSGVRIIAPIPGRGTVGVEMPNAKLSIVSIEGVLNTRRFQETNMELPCAIGRTTTNEAFMFNLATLPHLLVAGATGQGKSSGLHAIITSLLYKKHPAELKLVLIDTKGTEFNVYASLANHFLACCPLDKPIITDAKVAAKTLKYLCAEMDSRLSLLKSAQVRNIKEYNKKFIMRQLNPERGHRFLPYIVTVIDDYGELKMSGGNDVEASVMRLMMSAHIVGIHLVISTCRPTSNILTSEIKMNIPARLAFRVISKHDSQVILDCAGAERLIGKGDALFKNHLDIQRIQCVDISSDEIIQVVNYVAQQQSYSDSYDLPEPYSEVSNSNDEADLSHPDPLFEESARLIVKEQMGSTSLIQRKFSIGYNRAGRLMNQLEKAGIVGVARGSKPRDVLVKNEKELERIFVVVKKNAKSQSKVAPTESKFANPPKQKVRFSGDSGDFSPKKSPKSNVPNNIFGITEDYFNNTKEAVYSLVSLYNEIKSDVTIMNAVESMSHGVGTKEQKLASLFHADIMKLYQHLGHSTNNLRNKEGFALVLLSSHFFDGEKRLEINYGMVNLLGSICDKVPSLYSSLDHMFDQYPDDRFFFIGQILNRCRRNDLYVRYFTLLYRLFSIIAKADNTVTETEANWLKLLMEFTYQDSKNTVNLNIDGTSNSIIPDVCTDKEISNPIDELNKLVGLSNVKTEISSLSNLVKVQLVRKSRGMAVSNVSYHCVFTGNPGTGKTTVARIVADIYKQLGVLKKGHLVETDRSGLIAEYVGQTAVKTNAIIDSALDGVLFIDEAYSIVQGGQNDYGKEAIATLLKRMEDDRDRLVVILAGYSKEMADFINANSGLQSRFNRYIDFPDYSCEELLQIFQFILKSNECRATAEAIVKVKQYIQNAVENKDQNFGNARFVRNLFEKILTQQANRLASEATITNEMLSTIEAVDVRNAID